MDSHHPNSDSPIVPLANADALAREGAEPREGGEPVSLGFLTFSFLLLAVCFLFLGFNSGGFRADVYNPDQVSWEGGSSASAAPPDPKVVGKRIFTQNCAVCHQSDGLGVAGQFPPLAGSEWVLSQDWHGDNHIVKIVLNGLQGAVTVKGASYNNAMVPWGKVLNDDQISAVLTYIRSDWGNNAPPIPPEFVKKIRENTKDRTEQWTQKDLQAIGKELVSSADKAPAPAPAAEAPKPAAP